MNETSARKIVAERAAGRCELCGSTGPLTFAHRRAAGQGGLWRPSNGVRLCGSGTMGCHGWTEHEPDFAALGGWRIVHDERDPLFVPVWLNGPYGCGWFLLDDDGCVNWQYPPDLGLPEVPAVLPPGVRALR